MRFLGMVVLALVAGGPGSPAAANELDRLMEGEPDILYVQGAAVRYVDCTPDFFHRLERDAQAFGALPDLSLRGQLDADQDRDMDAFGNVEAVGEGQAWDLTVELEWDLADLVMSYERIRVLSEQQRRLELRARVLEDVTVAYYDRQRARARLQFEPQLGPDDRLRLQLEVSEATARLDALTGGAFSKKLEGDS